MTTNETTTHLNLPLPVATNDLSVDVDKLRQTIQALDLELHNYLTTLGGKADAGHDHAIEDIETLQTTLDELSSRTAPDNLNDLSDVDAASPVTGHFVKWQGSVWVPAKITLSDVENLTTGLNQKVNVRDFDSSVDARIQAIVGAAPEALDTLVELGASLNNDPDFAATMTTALAGKAAVGHSHSWGEITGKPSTFAPSSHNHNSLYYLKSEVDAAVASAGQSPDYQVFTSSGIWNKPAGFDDDTPAKILAWGGGGGGNRYRGGSGGDCAIWLGTYADLASSYSVAIGSGGAAGSSNGPGGAGGDTSFGSLLTASGGSGAGGSWQEPSPWGSTFGGGRGGGYPFNSENGDGARSVYGGGGGGSGNTGAAGESSIGGKGGAKGVAAAAPGGGGGGEGNNAGGGRLPGARGEVRIWIG